MRTIREFEERLHVDFAKGDIPGFVHLYAGEEASADRHHDAPQRQRPHRLDASRPRPLHRQGRRREEMMAEIYGKATGACRGKGGSMHIADLSKGMMGANGILGAGAPLVCGAALAAKYRGDGGVGISFVGDGASNQGTFLESLNLAAVWNLPAIFVVENNGYAESTSVDWAVAVRLLRRPRGRLRPARRHRRRHGFLRRLRGGRRDHPARARGRRPGAARMQDGALLRPFRRRRADLPRQGRARRTSAPTRTASRCSPSGSPRPASSRAAEFEAIDNEVARADRGRGSPAKAAPLPTAQELLTDVYVAY